MQIPLYQVDAFSGVAFKGNPAAVCPLERWLDDATMQAIAAENNLSETAFFVPRDGDFDLRWFTPTSEVDLCGHATLASAFVVLEILDGKRERVTFHSKSGPLTVTREGEQLTLDFPTRAPQRWVAPAMLEAALGKRPAETWRSADVMAVYENEEAVRALAPRMDRLLEMNEFAFIVTAPGKDCDFVSRFFAPAVGVPEDPVTGRAHCTLVPYWAERLGKTRLHARQISARGGELFCEHRGERVSIGGKAVLYLEGTIRI